MEPSVIIKILYSAAALQGIFLGVLLLRSKSNTRPNLILSILLFLLSFHLVLVGFDERDFFMTFPHLSRISWIIGSLYWPLLFLFVQSLTRYRLHKVFNVMLFLPFVIFLFLMIPYFSLGAEEKRKILGDFEKASAADFGWINRIVSLLHVIFQGLCLWLYHYIERRRKEEFSDSEHVRIKWLQKFLTGVFAITVLAVLSFFARDFEIPVFSNLYSFHFLGIVFFFYWLSYQALTKPVVFGLQAIPEVAGEIQATDPELDKKLQHSFQLIRQVLEAEKLYKRPALTLTELADSAGVARHIASEAINSQTNGNFFDLINDLRIEEFKRLVIDPSTKNLTIVGIAQESGFNSKASFYAIFRKKMGMTPTAYVEKHCLNA